MNSIARYIMMASLVLAAGCGGGGSSSPSSDPAAGAERYVDTVFAEVQATTNIAYAQVPRSSGSQTLYMDVYRPRSDTIRNRPAIILAHGGGFTSGQRQSVSYIAENFARRGYVTATIDYRFFETSPQTADQLDVAIIEAMHDMKAAVRFLRASTQNRNRFGIDGASIFVGGVSAGAIIANFTGTLDGGDNLSEPVTNFLSANGGVDGNIGNFSDTSSDIQGVFSMSGAVTDFLWVDSFSAPLYAAHEENDQIVPCRYGIAQSGFNLAGGCDLVREARLDGVPAELYLVENSSGHVDFTERQQIQIFNGVARFFAGLL